MFLPCIAGLRIANQHCSLGFVNVFITDALLYQFTYCILLLLPASMPSFYHFIHPLYILDMTDSVLLWYLPIVSFWLWLIVGYTPFCIF
jgi:hypothetical protein